MQIHIAAPSCVLLETSWEPSRKNCDALIRFVLVKSGLSPWTSAEVFLISGKNSCLLIATPSRISSIKIAPDLVKLLLHKSGE
jgi:hypothetical protein